ncbi:hypothetical protein BU26DRAFT_47144 [Trematosphaeria pertusa]|uniref:Uncharacterized protein n=1 Tax=Trematosphaeria pertusa TaxID=390896 RepID=A0A6A6IAD0_9PLEO|nr:uncharacterized protein BU26DRAFT_47144 [Trematosphaeria pertusa]KAF2246490.1 hypothetical protein BU26DRAFT_47144 [Trematosphaeria pertusa]
MNHAANRLCAVRPISSHFAPRDDIHRGPSAHSVAALSKYLRETFFLCVTCDSPAVRGPALLWTDRSAVDASWPVPYPLTPPFHQSPVADSARTCLTMVLHGPRRVEISGRGLCAGSRSKSVRRRAWKLGPNKGSMWPRRSHLAVIGCTTLTDIHMTLCFHPAGWRTVNYDYHESSVLISRLLFLTPQPGPMLAPSLMRFVPGQPKSSHR